MPSGYDQVINWGLFDFEAPNFVYRFVKGETDYMCGTVPADYFINSYLRDGRTVTEQILDLTPAQTDSVPCTCVSDTMSCDDISFCSRNGENAVSRGVSS